LRRKLRVNRGFEAAQAPHGSRLLVAIWTISAVQTFDYIE